MEDLLFRLRHNPSHLEAAEMRGLLTETDLFVWQNMLHQEVEQAKATNGIRLACRADQVMVNDETVAFPEYFPWVFPNREQAEAMDIEDRRTMVARQLKTHACLARLYPRGFAVVWYL